MRKILSAALALVCIWFATPAHAALPSGYTQLEYIESERGAYIDTGIPYGKFVHDIQFTIDGQRNLLGCGVSDSQFWEATAADRFIFSSSSNGYILGNPANRNIVEFSINTTEASLTVGNDTRTHTHGNTSNRTYLLFSLNGSTTYSALAKLYSLKVYNDSDVLIQDLVPAKRNSDGAVGLYDTVSGEFFENKGEGTFVAGPVAEIKIATTKYNENAFGPLNTALANAISVVDTVVSNTITQAGRIATLQTQKQTRPNDIADDNEKCPSGKKCLLVTDASGVPHWYEIVERYSLLPDGYTELQYIESTGTQYIDTGVNIGEDIQTKVRFGKTTNTFSRFGFIIGGKGNYQGLVSRTDRDSYYASMYNSSEHTLTKTITDDVFDFTFNVAGHKVVLNNTEIGTLTPISPYSTDGNVGVFRSPGTSSSNNNGIGKVYLFVITNSLTNVMLFNGIPAKRNSDGAIGMFDTVSGTFYENAGTGEFIAGDPVSE